MPGGPCGWHTGYFHPTTPIKVKIRQTTCGGRCAQVDERLVIVVPTMTAADPGAEFSQKWIISDYLLGGLACWAQKK